MTQTQATATWTDECPTKADAGDAYYFVRRKDKCDVVVMGFSMGKAWLNGVSYEPSEMRSHLFLGPITPELFNERDALLQQVRELREALRSALSEIVELNGRCDHHPVYAVSCTQCEVRAALDGKGGEGDGA